MATIFSGNKMKIRKLKEGDTLEVGDLLRHENWMGRKHNRVERVTKCYAFVRLNDKCLQKYKRVIGWNDPWSQTTESFWRPIEEEVKVQEVKE